jgi:hypothetical protein
MGNLRQSMTEEEWNEMGEKLAKSGVVVSYYGGAIPYDDDTEEKVDHPQHYGGKDNPYEAIKVIDAWGLDFALGNAVKYISRAGKKTDSPLEDLEKAKWYICHAIEKCKQRS